MQQKILSIFLAGALTLTLVAPSVSLAEDAEKNLDRGNSQKGVYRQSFKMNFSESKKIDRAELMELVQKYTPELVDQFQSSFDNSKKQRAPHQQLDEATKEKLNEIRQQVKDGTLTREQAKEEMEKLDIEFFGTKKVSFKKFGDDRKIGINQELQKAVEAEDEEQIKTLLTELLNRMQSKMNQSE